MKSWLSNIVHPVTGGFRPLVNGEKCDVPSTIGEDYSGAKCTGTVSATVTNRTVMAGGAGAEDYSGFQPAVAPDRDRGSIVLDLKLKEKSSASPTAASAKLCSSS
jgi:hypothetical protein